MTAPTVTFNPTNASPGDVVTATITNDPGARDQTATEPAHLVFTAAGLKVEGDVKVTRVVGLEPWAAEGWEVLSDDGTTAVLRTTIR